MMNGEHNAPQTQTQALDSHIKGLELEEQGAFLRPDWSKAASKVLKKAALKEARHHNLARGQKRA